MTIENRLDVLEIKIDAILNQLAISSTPATAIEEIAKGEAQGKNILEILADSNKRRRAKTTPARAKKTQTGKAKK